MQRLFSLLPFLVMAVIGSRPEAASPPGHLPEEQIDTAQNALTVLQYPTGRETFGFGIDPHPNAMMSTIGQVITVPEGKKHLHRFGFQFWLMSGTSAPATAHALIYEWDGSRAVGPPLYETAFDRYFPNEQPIYWPWGHFEADGLELVPGKQYVFFMTADLEEEYVTGNNTVMNDLYPGGHLVWQKNAGDPSRFTTVDWNQEWGMDLSFYAVFDEHPHSPVRLTASSNPAAGDEVITITATVTSELGTPTGTITFLNGVQPIGEPVALDAAGKAFIEIGPYSLGNYEISAFYSGDDGYGFIPSAALNLSVNKLPTTTRIISTPKNPLRRGERIVYQVAVEAEKLGPPSGAIHCAVVRRWEGELSFPYYAGSNVSLNEQGEATCDHNVGWTEWDELYIYAAYIGHEHFLPSESEWIQQWFTWTGASTLFYSTKPTTVYGESFTLTAEFSGSPGLPTGLATFSVDGVELGTVPLDGSGVASLVVPGLPAGTHSILVTYYGDGTYGLTESTITQVVTRSEVSLGLTPTITVARYGEDNLLVATVSGSEVPAGEVAFYSGDVLIDVATFDEYGNALGDASGLGSGVHEITAHFSGDDNFLPSTSPSVVLEVLPADTTTALFSSNVSSTIGGNVTFTVTVEAQAPGAGIPTGSVMFRADGVPLGEGELDGTGEATFLISSLAIGTHSITAEYSGDANFVGSASAALLQQIVKDVVSVALTSSKNPGELGEEVELIATVTTGSTGGIPTGEVVFFDGASELGRANLDAAGNARFAISSLALGSHSLRVEYAGDGNHEPGSSSTLNQEIQRASSAVSLSSVSNPSAFGESVTLTATVTSHFVGMTPTGVVSFVADGVDLGSASLDASGVAEVNTSVLAVGSHEITAHYAGDDHFAPGISDSIAQVVDKAQTSTSLASSDNPSIVGSSVTFTATVSVTAPGAGIPTGTVVFRDGDVALGDGALDDAGVATFSTSALITGAHAITAEYDGDSSFAGSISPSIDQQVDKDDVTVALVSSQNPSTFGDTVALTATVTTVATGGVPTGEVVYFDGPTEIGRKVLDGNGAASLSISSLGGGSHSLRVEYAGDENHESGSSPALVQEVAVAPSAVALESSAAPAAFGEDVTFTATVTSDVASAIPTGAVSFTADGAELGSSSLDALGIATLTTSALAVGAHVVVAHYEGDDDFAAATSPSFSQTVDQAQTSTTFVSSNNPSIVGSSVTFTATVAVEAPGAGTPTGTVVFRDGADVLGDGTLDGDGVASFTTSSLATGAHAITAEYQGDSSFVGSVSPNLEQQIEKDGVTVTLVSSANPSTFGEAITLTTTVTTVETGGAPTGDVVFFEGSTELGRESLDGSGSASLSLSNLRGGSHSFHVEYSGDENHEEDSSTALVQVVNVATSTVSLESSINPSVFGEAITFTATVTSNVAGAIPTGAVTFAADGVELGVVELDATGVASLTTDELGVDTHEITAHYEGDDDFSSWTSDPINQVVDQAQTTTTLASSEDPGTIGLPLTFTATVAVVEPGAGKPTGTVSFRAGDDWNGYEWIGDATLDDAGVASISTSSLPIGSVVIIAEYEGDSNFAGSVSPKLQQDVYPDGVILTVVSSRNPSTFGEPITLDVQVRGAKAGGIPTGKVVVYDDSIAWNELGSGTLDDSGNAIIPLSGLRAGSHTLRVAYQGDANHSGGMPTTFEQVVEAAPSTVTLTSNTGSSVFGEDVTFTATVTSDVVGVVPTGFVSLIAGGIEFDRQALDASGTATLTTSGLAVGMHDLTAHYEGDDDFGASTSEAVGHAVGKAQTSTMLASSANPAPALAHMTFTATVAAVAPGRGTPTGAVDLLVDGEVVASGTLDGDGVASIGVSGFPVGTHDIDAVYVGDDSFESGQSATLTQVVNPAESTVQLTTSTSPSAFGEAVTFTVTVTSQAAGVVPTGLVMFSIDDVEASERSLDATGIATLTTNELVVGVHEITAYYVGDANHAAGSSSVLDQTVEKAQTTTTLLSSLNPAPVHSELTFTTTVAAVAPGSGTPTGQVTLYVDGEALASADLDDVGIASFTLTESVVGEFGIEVGYEGDDSFEASRSAVVVQTVDPRAATITVSVSPEAPVFGEAMTLAVEVAGEPATPSGSVVLVLEDEEIDTGVLDEDGRTGFSLTPSRAGTHALTLRYAGDASFAETEAGRVLTVAKASTETTLAASTDSPKAGEVVAFTATVQSSASGMTGEIEVFDGSTSLGSTPLADGEAVIEFAGLPPGDYSLRAHYRGDRNFEASTSEALSLRVQVPATDDPKIDDPKSDDPDTGGWWGCSAAASGEGNGGAAVLACVMLLGIATRRRPNRAR